jgi:hypothetical protein
MPATLIYLHTSMAAGCISILVMLGNFKAVRSSDKNQNGLLVGQQA